MRCKYRETKYFCGDYTEVDIYPVFSPPKSRRQKSKPTTAMQRLLNQKHAARKIIQLANTNFTDNDIRFDLTYDPYHLPADLDDALRRMQNFFRRVKRYRKRQNLPALKYLAVTQYGEESGRIHHHIIMSGGIDINTLDKIWGQGYTCAKPLRFDDRGIANLAGYMVRNTAARKRWSASRNLTKPTVRSRDGRVSQKEVRQMSDDDTEIKRQYETLLKGYTYTAHDVLYNEVNGGYYMTVYLRKTPAKRQRKKE